MTQDDGSDKKWIMRAAAWAPAVPGWPAYKCDIAMLSAAAEP